MIKTEWDMLLLFVAFADFFISFYSTRAFCSGYLNELNEHAYEKEKKGQSIIEWVFFTKFKKQLPKVLLFINAFGVISHLLMVIAFIILVILRAYVPAPLIISYTIWISLAINIAWLLPVVLLNSTVGCSVNFQRWIRRRGKKWED